MAAPANATAKGEPALHTRGLVKVFGSLRAVDGVDLSIRRGECFGLLDPNGAGKTTTIEILEGLTRHEEGEVRVLGGAPGSREVKARIGIALQETQLPDKLTVEETVRLFRSFYPEGRDVDEVITSLELDEKRRARTGGLSGGQKQRLALACALVGDPELLFLDEPTTGLDPQAHLKVWDIVLDFKRAGGTVLLTTHYMEEAARLCDTIAVLDRGRVIAKGSASPSATRRPSPYAWPSSTTGPPPGWRARSSARTMSSCVRPRGARRCGSSGEARWICSRPPTGPRGSATATTTLAPRPASPASSSSAPSSAPAGGRT